MTNEEIQKLLDEATPGPWGYTDATKFKLEKSRYINGAFQVFGDECDLHAVADCSCNHTCREPDQCEANARLIAAAPDLAAELIRVRQGRDELRDALKDATDALGKFVDTGKRLREPYETPLSAYDRARAALAKWGA